MSETGNAVAKKLRSDRCEERWPCSVEFCACNALDEGADEIDRLCRALDEMQNMLRDSEARLAEVEAENERLREPLQAFVDMGEGYGWDNASTGRELIMRDARAALAQTKEPEDERS